MTGRFRWRLALLAAVGLPLACEPQPHYPTPDLPLVGVVQAERQVIVGEAAQDLGFGSIGDLGFLLHISLPAGAYPAGTRLVVRLLTGPGLPVADTDLQLGSLTWARDFAQGPVAAFQILPANVAPARLDPAIPLHVEVQGAFRPWDIEVLHASEQSAAWSVVSTLAAGNDVAAFDVTKPGLWALGQLPLPPALLGHWERTALACSTVSVPQPLARSLDLIRNTYRQISLTAEGCEVEERGTITRLAGYPSEGCPAFVPADPSLRQRNACLGDMPTINAVTWRLSADPDAFSGCPTNRDVTETFVVSGPAVAAPANGSSGNPCSTDGGLGHGQGI